MPPGFDPKSGSVRPKQPSFSPFCIGGSQVCFLLVAAELVNRIHAQARLHADKAAHARVAALEFLRHQAVFHVAHAGAAVALERRAEESQVGHGLHQFAREAPGAVAFLDDGNQVVFDELARGVADEALFVGEQGIVLDEIDTAKFDGWHHDLLKKQEEAGSQDRPDAGGQTYDGSRAKHAGQRERNRLTLRSEQTLQTRDPSRSRAFQPRDMVSRFFSPIFLKYSFLTTCGTGAASSARKILSRKDLRVKSSRIRT